MTSFDDVKLVLAVLPDPYLLVGDDERILFANSAFEAAAGYPAGGLAGLPLFRLLPNGPEGSSCIDRHGSMFPVTVRRATIVIDGRPAGVLAVHDQREAIAARADLYREARTDALTGLDNRRALADHVDDFTHDRRGGGMVTVLTVDVDHFKDLNDHLGHLFGDTVLVHVATELRSHMRGPDRLIRMGGDEFLVISRLDSTHHIADFAARLVTAVSGQIHSEDHVADVSVSIGIAAAPVESADVDRLLAASDASLYRAKQTGRARCGPVVELAGDGPTPERSGPKVDLRDER